MMGSGFGGGSVQLFLTFGDFITEERRQWSYDAIRKLKEM